MWQSELIWLWNLGFQTQSRNGMRRWGRGGDGKGWPLWALQNKEDHVCVGTCKWIRPWYNCSFKLQLTQWQQSGRVARRYNEQQTTFPMFLVLYFRVLLSQWRCATIMSWQELALLFLSFLFQTCQFCFLLGQSYNGRSVLQPLLLNSFQGDKNPRIKM